MITDLPEGSNYVSRLASVTSKSQENDEAVAPEPDPFYEQKTWTEDRRLMAQLINQLNMLIRFSVPWEQGKEPSFPIVGPAQWRDVTPAQKPSRQLTVFDVIQTVTGQ